MASSFRASASSLKNEGLDGIIFHKLNRKAADMSKGRVTGRPFANTYSSKYLHDKPEDFSSQSNTITLSLSLLSVLCFCTW
jgi:hypothetical protein